jgi:hypothetical protein
MLTQRQAAADYADATDGCRRLALGTRDNAPHWQRVKPDPETNPLADLDCEKAPTWDEQQITIPPPRRCSGRTDCIEWATQPPALSVPPTGTGCVAAV